MLGSKTEDVTDKQEDEERIREQEREEALSREMIEAILRKEDEERRQRERLALSDEAVAREMQENMNSVCLLGKC